MKSGTIPDSAITASESQSGYGPEHARIDNPQGWYTPERTASRDWLQIDTGSVHYITKIATQVIFKVQILMTLTEERRIKENYRSMVVICGKYKNLNKTLKI